MNIPDGMGLDMTGAMVTKADLDGFWIRESFTGKMKAGGGFSTRRHHVRRRGQEVPPRVRRQHGRQK
ncbi:MAG: hypothetical protein H0T79_21180 [Deltaproteobacteria bacterium]|nr:hypothetical protein [Deltaproteobacteria bacterium]